MKIKQQCKTMAFFLNRADKVILSAFLFLLLSINIGCSSNKAPAGSRYKLKHDKYPTSPKVSFNRIKDATPKIEPKSKRGNPSSYVVLKKKYYVKDSSKGYKERGIASFYGTKFHGHETSNGEIYDMYAMTAAHKTLPLPSYVEVKNINNGKKIIVRVNDRGPFHDGRIIDLSYSAAHKLGMLGRGTAKVEVTAIDTKSWLAKNSRHHNPYAAKVAKIEPSSIVTNEELKLQLGAFSNKRNAVALADKLKNELGHPVSVIKTNITSTENINSNENQLFKVVIGPISKSKDLETVKSKLLSANLPSPVVVN